MSHLMWKALVGTSLVLALGFGAAGCDSLDPRVGAEETRGALAVRAAADESTPTSRNADLGLARQLSSAFEDVAERVSPSVVSISTQRNPRQMQRQRGPGGQGGQQPENPFEGTPYSDFFDRFFGPNGPQFGPGGPGAPQFPQEGLGSGFIVSKDGYVLTNAHVVDGADEITVRTTDERNLKATLVGSDPQTDLAVLKVENGGLDPLPLGDSDTLRVGQWVVAAGTPFGLSTSITSGIVSATGRSNLRIADYEDFIQTDAAINPGNSGGPLLDLDGKVVGINTAIFSRTGGYMGIGFAIPINMARDVMDSLIEDGKVTRGRIGVRIQDLDEDLAASFGYGSRDGVLVGDVEPASPAEKAGLQSGDIITKYDGQPVKRTDDLRLRVAATRPGEDVDLEIFRDGRSKKVPIEIGELESDQVASNRTETELDEGIGVTVRSLTPELREQLGLEAEVEGALVLQVEPFGPAADAGLRQGDVIVQVQGTAVASPEDLRRELDKYELSEGVRVVVLSNGARRFAILKAD